MLLRPKLFFRHCHGKSWILNSLLMNLNDCTMMNSTLPIIARRNARRQEFQLILVLIAGAGYVKLCGMPRLHVLNFCICSRRLSRLFLRRSARFHKNRMRKSSSQAIFSITQLSNDFDRTTFVVSSLEKTFFKISKWYSLLEPLFWCLMREVTQFSGEREGKNSL